MATESSGSAETSLSARFDERELAYLREAAAKRQWSLAQLIRTAAYEKSVNILNAANPGVHAIRRLVGKLVAQLVTPTVFTEDPATGARMAIDDEVSGYDIVASTVEREDVQEFATAIRLLGPELASIVLDELQRATSKFTDEAKLIDPTLIPGQPAATAVSANLDSGPVVNVSNNADVSSVDTGRIPPSSRVVSKREIKRPRTNGKQNNQGSKGGAS